MLTHSHIFIYIILSLSFSFALYSSPIFWLPSTVPPPSSQNDLYLARTRAQFEVIFLVQFLFENSLSIPVFTLQVIFTSTEFHVLFKFLTHKMKFAKFWCSNFFWLVMLCLVLSFICPSLLSSAFLKWQFCKRLFIDQCFCIVGEIKRTCFMVRNRENVSRSNPEDHCNKTE